ncbi:MAG: extracellular solute-binding protein [Ruminococcus sp.]|nr:extracellular solute-binding protein [Ruminococcus sp.]
MGKIKRRLGAVLLAAALGFSTGGFGAFAAEEEATAAETETAAVVEETAAEEVQGFVRATTYSDYYDSIVGNPRPDVEVPLKYRDRSWDADVYIGTFEGKKDIIVWENQSGSLNFNVIVPESGNYNIMMSYYPIVGRNSVSEASVLIDGVSPYDSATRIEVPRRFMSEHPIVTDSRDNEMLSPQVESPTWLVTPFKDNDGLFNEPLLFYLEKGAHVITIESEKAAFAIEYIKLYNEKPVAAYVKPSEAELAQNANAETIKLQGEKYAYTNNQSIVPVAVRNEYGLEPSNPVKQRYNAVGVWDKAGQAVEWQFNVSTAGYYKVYIKARQNELRGLASNRRLYIDGVVPSDAFDAIKFEYSTDWVSITATDEAGDPAYVYLEPGKHTISLESIPGEIGDVMRVLDGVVYDINNYYMDILMITGPNPDQYTDYNIHIEIPGIVDDFNRIADELMAQMAEVERIAGTKGTTATALERMAQVLYNCAKYPRRIPNSIRNTAIKSGVSATSAWMRQNRAQPLRVDYIEIVPATKEPQSDSVNIFKAAGFAIEGFVGSFFEDYTRLSDFTAESIDVWVNVGRDQTNIVKQMTDGEFTEEYKVPVAINLVQGTIMEAVLAGKGPDVALFLGGEFPINLAIRGLLQNVDDYEGFDEVAARFQSEALVPYQFEGKTYGIPIVRSFPALFYRKDLLAEVGVTEPPETWDDLINILPALQRKYMQPGLILPMSVAAGNGTVTSIQPSVEVGHTFALMMLQRGDNWYNADHTATTFTTPQAYESFETWTDFYNIYKFDQVYDAFTRFRTGEAPIVIQNYNTFYNQLNVAAPEIKGLWDFTLVPGTVQEDGTISHAANSGTTGAIILKSCNNADGAWKFIKWFTDTDAQVEYARNVEGVLGPLGRVDTANVEALQRLNWSASELAVINAQMDELREIPITPSAYVVTRELMNAFREVVNNKYNPRYELNEYNVKINNEILRKRENLGLD